MANLIILMGTSGVGKTSVAKELTKKDYRHINFDELVKKLFAPRKNWELTGEEIKAAYFELGKQTNELLKISSVVIDEWFYLENTYDWFRTQITSIESDNIFCFQLDCDLKTIIERNENRQNPIPKAMLIKHYHMTYDKPSVSYEKLMPTKIDASHPPEFTAGSINTLIQLQWTIRMQKKLSDYSSDE